MTDERQAADALGDAIDEIHRLQAELTELRALKAKIDGCVVGHIAGNEGSWVDLPDGDAVLYAAPLLAWLREASDDRPTRNGYRTPMSNDPNAANSGTRQPEPGTATRQPAQKQGQRQGPKQGDNPAEPGVTIDHPEGDVNVDNR